MTFDITVVNQGNIDATAIEVVDYIPAGLTLADAAWTDNGDGSASFNQPFNLAEGDQNIIQIAFTVDQGIGDATLINRAEIADARDENGAAVEDIDSTPDTAAGNDTGGEVNTADDDNASGNGREGEDEDDADPEDIQVEIFDLALRKTLNAQTQLPIANGRTVTFDIEVFNQGTVNATDIEVVDYIPDGLTLADSDWTEAGGIATFNRALSLGVGQSETIQVSFTVDIGVEGFVENTAEISEAADESGDPAQDIDSTPDTNISNDTTDDNSIDNENGDEDDACLLYTSPSPRDRG